MSENMINMNKVKNMADSIRRMEYQNLKTAQYKNTEMVDRIIKVIKENVDAREKW